MPIQGGPDLADTCTHRHGHEQRQGWEERCRCWQEKEQRLAEQLEESRQVGEQDVEKESSCKSENSRQRLAENIPTLSILHECNILPLQPC